MCQNLGFPLFVACVSSGLIGIAFCLWVQLFVDWLKG